MRHVRRHLEDDKVVRPGGRSEVVTSMIPSPTLGLGALSLTLALFTAACTGSGSQTATDDGSIGGSTFDHVTATTAYTADVPYGRQMVAWEQAAQQGIAKCMAERGFEYIAYFPQHVIDRYLAEDETAGIEVLSPSLEGLTMPFPMMPMTDDELARTMEAAKTEGYVIFIAPELHDDPDAVNQPLNPNEAIINAMSEEERAEYHRALQGRAAEDVTEDGEIVGGSPDTPCFEIGRQTAGPEPERPNQLSDIDVERLIELSDKVYRLANADPAMTEADAAYVACLAERGAPPDPWQYVANLKYTEMQRLTGDSHGVLPETGDGWEADLAAALGMDKLREYQETERAMAVAQLECLGDRNAVEMRLLLQYQEEALRAEPDVAAMLGIDLDG